MKNCELYTAQDSSNRTVTSLPITVGGPYDEGGYPDIYSTWGGQTAECTIVELMFPRDQRGAKH